MITFSFLANEIVKIIYILPFMSKLREIYFDTRTNGSQARVKKSLSVDRNPWRKLTVASKSIFYICIPLKWIVDVRILFTTFQYMF